jgi:hypothetical protein
VNARRNEYKFSFVSLQLYKTKESTNFINELNLNDILRLNYDIESANYWEIKKYIPRSERERGNKPLSPVSNTDKPLPTISPIVVNHINTVDEISTEALPFSRLNTYLHPNINVLNSGWSVFSDFTNIFDVVSEQDHIDMMDDYEIMNREIYDNIECMA